MARNTDNDRAGNTRNAPGASPTRAEGTRPTRTEGTDRTRTEGADGATTARTETVGNEHPGKESAIGTDRRGTQKNASWGAIFAGVVTVLAVALLLSMITAAVGLGGSGTAAGVWGVVTLVLALAAGGYVAGALAVHGGLIHGFLTWAASLVAIIVLVGFLTTSLLGVLGGVVGQAVQAVGQATDITSEDVGAAADEAGEAADAVDPEQVEGAADEAQQVAGDAADTAQTGAWWAFAGLLIGAVIASVFGMLGSRSVITRDERQVVDRR